MIHRSLDLHWLTSWLPKHLSISRILWHFRSTLASMTFTSYLNTRMWTTSRTTTICSPTTPKTASALMWKTKTSSEMSYTTTAGLDKQHRQLKNNTKCIVRLRRLIEALIIIVSSRQWFLCFKATCSDRKLDLKVEEMVRWRGIKLQGPVFYRKLYSKHLDNSKWCYIVKVLFNNRL